ncbi:YxeA family protein [Staphylococcus cohnii]|uniref:YxeA family protein n=1 Tax=Staphylococcus cohnii TaxID=29382 RepID=UPI001CCE419B|nr:YxeA family protein [Staphylococcus cohnii]MBZ8172204.1 YxeA family protein [Staphylococcus cohnii]
MKKILILMPVVILALAIILIGMYLVSNGKKQEGEIAGLIDHINPLVKKKSSYVKTKKPDEFLEYDRVSYTQKAYDEQGESRNLTFTASQSLKLDKYLKITHKGAHVATYEEVNKQDIPKKAIEEIEK